MHLEELETVGRWRVTQGLPLYKNQVTHGPGRWSPMLVTLFVFYGMGEKLHRFFQESYDV
jgi:hypothetical protein